MLLINNRISVLLSKKKKVVRGTSLVKVELSNGNCAKRKLIFKITHKAGYNINIENCFSNNYNIGMIYTHI